MTITQTIDIPADRRITLPREIPTGRTVVTFTPAAVSAKQKMTDEEEAEFFKNKKNVKRLNKEAMDVLKYQVDIFREHTDEELEILRNSKATVFISEKDLVK